MLAYALILSWIIGLAVLAVPILWRLRKFLLFIQGIGVLFACFSLLAKSPNTFSLLLSISSLYVAFNVFRVYEARMNERYLKVSVRRTGIVLIVFQIILAGGWLAWSRYGGGTQIVHFALIGWLAASIAAASAVFLSLTQNIIKSRPRRVAEDFIAKLPTLSVCVPARNETNDLQECLETLVASDYPKLEIIVLDDCSQTRYTPEIIRSFAQSGVQFIAGTEPAPHWLAKNWAYEQLLQAASGELVLFCGVDTRFTPESLRQVVTELLFTKMRMISVLPERLDRQYFSLIQPMRYFWELAMPRYLFKRPPVLSTCWVASRQSLLKLGGFAAVTRQIVPEAYFARRFSYARKYSFVRGLDILGVSSRKSAVEQRATAFRTRYPQFHRRPELVMLFSLAELAFLVAPFGFFVAGWFIADKVPLILAAVASFELVTGFVMMTLATITPSALLSLITFPFAVISDVILMHISMYKYELSVVEWKNRNICIPAMHVYPKLPEANDGKS